ncbi:hypothetical protein MAR_013025 [Mya arenaria]|uniref:Uncharacterized protein n=1 Tax=Mya arenaria TaxID=6604 RepID=A0ABY7G2T0_MYAAR|nr:hypothetical protein MAR_013025 [Mya arenaria]
MDVHCKDCSQVSTPVGRARAMMHTCSGHQGCATGYNETINVWKMGSRVINSSFNTTSKHMGTSFGLNCPEVSIGCLTSLVKSSYLEEIKKT